MAVTLEQLAAETSARIPVACGDCGWDDDGTLALIDRWRWDYPPIPYVQMIEVHGDSGEGRAHLECLSCGSELGPETVDQRVEPPAAAVA